MSDTTTTEPDWTPYWLIVDENDRDYLVGLRWDTEFVTTCMFVPRQAKTVENLYLGHAHLTRDDFLASKFLKIRILKQEHNPGLCGGIVFNYDNYWQIVERYPVPELETLMPELYQGLLAKFSKSK